MFHFVTEKEHNPYNIALLHLKSKKKKPNLPVSELTQVFCGLLSKYF